MTVLRNHSQEAGGGEMGCSSKGTRELWKCGSGKSKINEHTKSLLCPVLGHR